MSVLLNMPSARIKTLISQLKMHLFMKSFTGLLLLVNHCQQIFIDNLHLMRRQSTRWQCSHLTYEFVM